MQAHVIDACGYSRCERAVVIKPQKVKTFMFGEKKNIEGGERSSKQREHI